MKTQRVRRPRRDPETPTLHERAAVLKQKARALRTSRGTSDVVTPELASLVAQWCETDAQINSPSEDERDGDAIAGLNASLQRQIYAFPARSVADLAAKLPCFREELGAVDLHLGKPSDHLDAHAWRCVVRDLEGLSHAAPTASLRPGKVGLSPSVGRRDEAALTLVDAIEREWARWARTDRQDAIRSDEEQDTRWKPLEDRRDALLAAADALPAATRDQRHAKALALAWLDYVEHWRHGCSREQYENIDAGLAIDIEAGIRGSASPNPALARCEAARIGAAIERQGRKILQLDEEGASTAEQWSPLDYAWSNAQAELEALRFSVSHVRARSFAGMLAQIAVASDLARLAHNGTRMEDRQEAAEAVDRCLYSVGAALCALTGIDRESHGAGYLLPPRLDRLAVLDTVATKA